MQLKFQNIQSSHFVAVQPCLLQPGCPDCGCKDAGLLLLVFWVGFGRNLLFREQAKVGAECAYKSLQHFYGKHAKQTIGYHIGDDNVTSKKKNNKYGFSNQRCALFEGNVQPDLCLAMVVELHLKFPQIRIIIMSATLHDEKCIQYFGKYNLNQDFIEIPRGTQT